jgi:iron complex outermembrane receptor protein
MSCCLVAATPRKPVFRRPLIHILAAGAAMIALQAQAQPATGDKVQEVVVTARRRAESAHLTPLAVHVVSAGQARTFNLNDLQDITASVPSANFRTSSSNKDRTLFVRGIGTISTSPGVEPSVATVIDGVVLGRSGQTTADILDLDHIEVLSGPQGTLFGKNASAGVLNIVTKTPTDTFHAYAEGSYYQGNEYRLSAGVSGALIPGLLDGQLAGVYADYAGNVKNLYNGQTVNGYQDGGFRGKLKYTPTNDLTLTLAADYIRTDSDVPNGVWTSAGQEVYPTGKFTLNTNLANLLASEGIKPSLNNTTINNDYVSNAGDDNGGISLSADYRLGGYTLSSITAYRAWNNIQHQDYDQLGTITSAFPGIQDTGYLYFDQFSQELRVASPKGGLVDYVAGLYYLNEYDSENYHRVETSLTTGDNMGVADYGTVGNNVAGFGEANINLTNQLRLIAGVRVIYDSLSFHEVRDSTSPVAVTGIAAGFAANGSVSRTDYSDRLGVQYQFNPNIEAYFTYARGYKGPAYNVYFNQQARDTSALLPETSNDFEIGLKNQLFDDRLRLDLVGFIDDFNNFQANFSSLVAGAIVSRLINAGTVSTKGFEADATAVPFHNLTLNFDLLRDFAQIDQFACPSGATSSCNVNGQPLPFAPGWKLDANAQYAVTLTPTYQLNFNTDYNWQSKTQYQLTETPDTIQPAYGIWDGAVTLINTDQDWKVSFLVKNMLDQHYSSYITHGDLGGVVRYVPRDNSRYVGVSARKDF